jgi:hypothetical protein
MRSAVDSGEAGTLFQLEAVKGYSLWDESFLIQAVAHSEASGDVFARAFTVEMYAHYLGANGQYIRALSHNLIFSYFNCLIIQMVSNPSKGVPSFISP